MGLQLKNEKGKQLGSCAWYVAYSDMSLPAPMCKAVV
jgi:hypothetical protein